MHFLLTFLSYSKINWSFSNSITYQGTRPKTSSILGDLEVIFSRKNSMHTCLTILEVVGHHYIIIKFSFKRRIKTNKELQFFAHSWRKLDIASLHLGYITHT